MLAEFPQRFNVLFGDSWNRRSNLTIDFDEACQPIQGIKASRFHSFEGAPERIRTSVPVAADETTFGTAKEQFNNDVVPHVVSQAELASGFSALRLLGVARSRFRPSKVFQ